MKTVGRMTVRELERVVERVVEGSLHELIGDPDEGLELRASVKRRLRRTRGDTKKKGVPADTIRMIGHRREIHRTD